MKNELVKKSSVKKQLAMGLGVCAVMFLASSPAFADMTSSPLLAKGDIIKDIYELLMGPVAWMAMGVAFAYTIIKNWGGSGGGWVRDGFTFCVPAIIFGNFDTIIGMFGIHIGGII